MRLLLLSIFICTIFFHGNGIPMRCTKISSTFFYDTYDGYVNNQTYAGSAVLSVYKRENVQYISMSDISVVNIVQNLTATSISVNDEIYFTDLSIPLEFEIENTTFEICAFFPKGNGICFIEGLVDDESFLGIGDATMFNGNNLCSTDLMNRTYYLNNQIQCCMAFQPAPEAPKNNPRCTKFKSRSSILNVNDNYSIFATSNVTFTLSENILSGSGHFSEPPSGYNYTVSYGFDGSWLCGSRWENPYFACRDFQLTAADSKIFFEVDFVDWNLGRGFPVIMGRIIIRDGQTLMEEGIPYTAKNNCQYWNLPNKENITQVINSEFCCIEFEDSFHSRDEKKDLKLQSNLPVIKQENVKHLRYDRIFDKSKFNWQKCNNFWQAASPEEKMTFILKFLRYNDMVAATLGVIANLFLIFLIFTVNKPNLKQLSYTLLQNCYLDLLLAVVTFVTEPQVVVVNGIYYNVLGSYFNALGYAFSSLTVGTYGTCLTLSVIAMPVPFYVRYLVLCKDTTATKSLFLKLYGSIFGVTVIVLLACIWCCWPYPSTYEMYAPALQTKFWLDQYPDGPQFCAIHPGDIRLILAFGLMCSCSFASYQLIMFFSFKIVRHLARSQSHMSNKTKELNKQLLKTLAVQAIGPLITGNFPICCSIIMIFLQYENHYATLATSYLLGWVSVINPLAAIFIIAPYRKRVKELLGLKNDTSTTNFDNTPSAQTKPSTSKVFAVNAASLANPVI